MFSAQVENDMALCVLSDGSLLLVTASQEVGSQYTVLLYLYGFIVFRYIVSILVTNFNCVF